MGVGTILAAATRRGPLSNSGQAVERQRDRGIIVTCGLVICTASRKFFSATGTIRLNMTSRHNIGPMNMKAASLGGYAQHRHLGCWCTQRVQSISLNIDQHRL